MFLKLHTFIRLFAIFSIYFSKANATSEIKNKITAEQSSLAPESCQKYFDTNTPELHFFDNILIYSVNNASDDCPGYDHPMVMALPFSNCVGWVQFIAVNSDPGISYSKYSNGTWHFVDILQTQYQQRDPLYTKSPCFFDNPRWGKPSEGTLCWSATTFPIFYENGKNVAGDGFSWGFEWSASDKSPQAMQITKVNAIDFNEYSDLFNDDFDFQKPFQYRQL